MRGGPRVEEGAEGPPDEAKAPLKKYFFAIIVIFFSCLENFLGRCERVERWVKS